MRLNISNYISTLLGPNGMFATLGNNIAPELDQRGDVDFWVEARIAHFKVRINGEQCILWCFLGDKKAARSIYLRLTKQFNAAQSPYVFDWTFLQDEMRVFDEHNNSYLCDVIVQKNTDAVDLEVFLNRCAMTNNRDAMFSLFKGLVRMTMNFYLVGINFRGINARAIKVKNESCQPIIAPSYMSSIIPTRYIYEAKGFLKEDTKSFALLSAAFFMFSFEPALYVRFGASNLFTLASSLSLLPIIRAFAELLMLQPLLDLLDIAEGKRRKNDMSPRNRLHHSLMELEKVDMDELKTSFCELLEQDAPLYAAFYPSSENDGLVCVKKKNNLFSYISLSTGVEAFDGGYEQALDFDNGRAVVSTYATEFGLIDTRGCFVVEEIYDDLVWYGSHSLIVSMLDGVFELRDKDGNKLSEKSYDYVGMLDNDLLPVRLDGRFGYVDCKDNLVLDFNYDDALSFCDGLASVRCGEQWHKINTKGEIVE